jgi:oxygen-independent coproporphyrinogen-3 oxidase
LRIILHLKPQSLYDSIHELVRMAYSGCEIACEGEGDMDFYLELRLQENAALLQAQICSRAGVAKREHSFPLQGSDRERLNLAKQQVRLFTYDLLCELSGQNINPYGILTGMRPVKLVHRMLDQGLKPEVIAHRLQADYRVQPEKAALLVEIATNNRSFLWSAPQAAKWISIYIGIPYCPSRCYYCSFPGAVLSDYETEIKPFLQALFTEIRALSSFLADLHLQVQCLYIGGGTPTVLSNPDLERLFAELRHCGFISPATMEITVEAGRPDTLDLSKLRLLEANGVNRICINPQTMHDATLKAIGRHHDQKGVIQALQLAREAGIEKINMDIITGLPGEGLTENTYTAEKILQLQPDNISVHTLALKRGSLMAGMETAATQKERTRQVEAGVKLFGLLFRQAGYVPYYLYRQKYMKANMENLGYSRPGSFCLYNIQVIEERQTIIGLGGGAASKFIDLASGRLESFYNPKNPLAYCQTVEKLISRKVDKLQALN